ncbi:UNVERIFIED_CONTAM: hypothetical protein PYX00_001246 [Menopon gallinae]|uniref:Uncharacterized protein n=1 Tax=Menopon gallinae TaxID=328185 RepID=A0AAW2IC55_9NEOP
MATESVAGSSKDYEDERKNKELQEILANVVQKRKTIPKKCMELSKQIIQLELKQLENAKVKLHEKSERHKFWELANKLKKTKPAKLSCSDLHEAEERVLRCYKKLQEINMYLKKHNSNETE